MPLLFKIITSTMITSIVIGSITYASKKEEINTQIDSIVHQVVELKEKLDSANSEILEAQDFNNMQAKKASEKISELEQKINNKNQEINELGNLLNESSAETEKANKYIEKANEDQEDIYNKISTDLVTINNIVEDSAVNEFNGSSLILSSEFNKNNVDTSVVKKINEGKDNLVRVYNGNKYGLTAQIADKTLNIDAGGYATIIVDSGNNRITLISNDQTWITNINN